jgi:hypothetical protein
MIVIQGKKVAGMVIQGKKVAGLVVQGVKCFRSGPAPTTWVVDPEWVPAWGGSVVVTFSRPVKLSYIFEAWCILDGNSEVTYNDFGTTLILQCDFGESVQRSTMVELDSDISENVNVEVKQYAT